jgi:hypothetical protein
VPDRRGDRAGRQLRGDRVVLALEVDVERDVGRRHGCEPGMEQRAASRVRVGEVERAAVGHLVVGGERIYQRRALGLLGTGAHRHDRPARGGGHARDLGERAARVGGVEHGVKRVSSRLVGEVAA